MREVIQKRRGGWLAGILVLAAGFLAGGVWLLMGGEMAWAEKRAIVISPSSQKMLLIPGETYEGSFLLSNPAQATGELHYGVSIGSYGLEEKAGGKDDYGNYNLEKRTTQNIMMDWIRLEEAEGEIAPNGSKRVRFFVEVPEDAPAGAQYATLIVRDTSGEGEGVSGGGVREVIQMVHVLYAIVAGETIEKGEVLENSVPGFVLDGQLTTSAMVENLGNIYTDAEFILQVWPNGSDEEVCTNEEKADEKLVLPGTKRAYDGGCQLPSAGFYKVRQTVRIFGEESVVEAMVMYCPIWIILANLVGCSLIGVWIYMVITGKGRAAKRMMGE